MVSAELAAIGAQLIVASVPLVETWYGGEHSKQQERLLHQGNLCCDVLSLLAKLFARGKRARCHAIR